MEQISPASVSTSRPGRWAIVAAYLAASLTPFTVPVVGKIPAGELVLIGVLALATMSMAYHQRWPAGSELLQLPLMRLILVCLAISLTGYFISDIYWHSTPSDMARGWARWIFLTLDIVALTLLFGQGRTAYEVFAAFQWGNICGDLVQVLALGALFGDFWKFGFGGPLTVAVLLLVPRCGFAATIVACLALGGVHFLMDFRSMAAPCLLTGGLMTLQRLPRKLRLFVFPACLAVVLIGLFSVYHESQRYTSGRAARSDIERSAMLTAAWNGFVGSPLLGNGSWFSKSKVMEDFEAIRYEQSVLSGVGSFAREDDGPEMTLHSQILVALAEGGILGGCFFFLYGIGLLWAMADCIFIQPWHRQSAIYLLVLICSFWNLWMSPFSGGHRVGIATATALVLALWRERSLARRSERLEAGSPPAAVKSSATPPRRRLFTPAISR